MVLRRKGGGLSELRALLFLPALFWLAGCAVFGGGAPVINVTLDRAGYSAAVSYDRGAGLASDTATIDVSSAGGIGGFTAALAEGDWPATVVVRLHTRGLEQLTIRYGLFDIVTGRSSNDSPDPALILYVEDEHGEVQSAPVSSYVYYPDIRVVRPQSQQPKLPAPGGYYEITLPPHFYQGEHPSFAMQWIDFYR